MLDVTLVLPAPPFDVSLRYKITLASSLQIAMFFHHTLLYEAGARESSANFLVDFLYLFLSFHYLPMCFSTTYLHLFIFFSLEQLLMGSRWQHIVVVDSLGIESF